MYLESLFGKSATAEHGASVLLEFLRMLQSESHKAGSADRFLMCAIEEVENGETVIHRPPLEDLLVVTENLCDLLIMKGNNDKAKEIMDQVISIRETTQGPDHAPMVTSVRNLGVIYKQQGKLDDAEKAFTRCLVGRKRLFGPNHLLTLRTVADLGRLYASQNRFQNAEDAYTRALDGFEKAFGSHNEMTLDTIVNLASLYDRHQKTPEAERMYTRALNIWETLLGPDHLSTLGTAGISTFPHRPAREGRRYVSSGARRSRDNKR